MGEHGVPGIEGRGSQRDPAALPKALTCETFLCGPLSSLGLHIACTITRADLLLCSFCSLQYQSCPRL